LPNSFLTGLEVNIGLKLGVLQIVEGRKPCLVQEIQIIVGLMPLKFLDAGAGSASSQQAAPIGGVTNALRNP
jgi:hypothetical protein